MSRDTIKKFYALEGEANRLDSESFMLEGIRTKEIIDRYLQKKGLEILDIGGGAGYYAFWLQQKGHHVTMVDISPKNIELVQKYAESSGISLTAYAVGDAVDLDIADEQFDVVLLLGPLYHLIERAERIRALSEAKRVLKPGGLLLAAVITRYGSMFDGFQRNLVMDDDFFNLMQHDLNTGVHLNETGNTNYFTTAYFHSAKEIIAEIEESELQFEKLIGVESFGWYISNIKEKLADPTYAGRLLRIINMVESNEDLIGMSPHIMAVAHK